MMDCCYCGERHEPMNESGVLICPVCFTEYPTRGPVRSEEERAAILRYPRECPYDRCAAIVASEDDLTRHAAEEH